MSDSQLTTAERADILDVLVRYATGIDQRDWELFRTCWSDDLVAEYDEVGTWHGGDEITDFMQQSHERCGTTMHRVSNLTAWREDGRVRARSYVDALVSVGTDQVARAVGMYHDELAQSERGWRIVRRRYEKVFFKIGAIDDVVF